MLYFTKNSDGEDDAGMCWLHEQIRAKLKANPASQELVLTQPVAIDLYTAATTLGRVRRPIEPPKFARTLKLSESIILTLVTQSRRSQTASKRTMKNATNRAFVQRQMVDGELVQISFDFDQAIVHLIDLHETHGDPTVTYIMRPGVFK